VSLQRFLVTR